MMLLVTYYSPTLHSYYCNCQEVFSHFSVQHLPHC